MVRIRRVALLGYPAVGKSSLAYQFSENKFADEYITTIANHLTVKTVVCGEEFEVHLYDTMGVAEMPSFEDRYLTMDGWVLVYSVTSKRSFDVVSEIYDKLTVSIAGQGGSEPPIVLVGNKTDLVSKREVTEEDGKALAQELAVEHLAVSAKNDDGVRDIFCEIIRQIEKAKGEPLKAEKRTKEDCSIL